MKIIKNKIKKKMLLQKEILMATMLIIKLVNQMQIIFKKQFMKVKK